MKRKQKTSELPMLMLELPDDWSRVVRDEMKRTKELYYKSAKNNPGFGFEAIDLDGGMEKRREKALLRSLEQLPEEQKSLFADWVMLNLISSSYMYIENENHLLYAASIWILDRFSESGTPWEELYKLLPTSEEEVADFYHPDIWDCQYSDELLESVEYVLHYRNRDIAPLEQDGYGSFRVLTSRLAAEGKCHADVPSRRRFEALLALLPEECKERAAAHFKEFYTAWKERFFAVMEPLNTRTRDLQERINKLSKKINQTQKQASQRMKDVTKQKYPQKKNISAVLAQPLQGIDASQAESPLESLHRKLNDPDVKNVFGMMEQVNAMNDQSKALSEELMEVIELRGKLAYRLGTFGYIPEVLCREDFGDDVTERMVRIPIPDPYELCFGLLYLIEQDDDIPWLYGSCLGALRELSYNLPWGLANYDESHDRAWNGTANCVARPAALPDWYAREYATGEFGESDRSLAQIVYEASGCIMPRNVHQYDYMLKPLGKYGIRQNKAFALLYCMTAMGNARHSVPALNLDEDYMATFEERPYQKPEILNPAELQNRNAELEKQIRQLRAALHSAEKAAESAKQKLTAQAEAFEAERRELADLREIVFKEGTEERDEPNADTSRFPYEVQRDTVIFGGHDSWVKAIKPLLTGNIRFVPREMIFDTGLVRHAEVIWIQANAMPHRTFYRLINVARQYDKPIRYFTFASAVKCAEQLLENDE